MNLPVQQLEPWEDPIIRETRSARESILQGCDYDLDRLREWLRERQQSEGRRAISIVPRIPGEPR